LQIVLNENLTRTIWGCPFVFVRTQLPDYVCQLPFEIVLHLAPALRAFDAAASTTCYLADLFPDELQIEAPCNLFIGLTPKALSRNSCTDYNVGRNKIVHLLQHFLRIHRQKIF